MMSLRQIVTTISRLLVGLLFIFSGLIKANDPSGFGYKLQEYFDVFGTPVFHPMAFGLAMFICVLEIFLGITLLMGVYRRFTVWMLLLMMIFFTFLTFYSAWYNKVTDCGCFGDAIKLTPWESFWKDVVLSVLIIVLFINWRYIRPLMSRVVGKTISFLGLGLSSIFTLYSYYYLPPMDFRPYKIGNNIKEQMEIPAGAPRDSFVMTFVYTKDGKDYEFKINELGNIDDTYTFKDRKDVKVREGYKPPIHDFAIFTEDGEDLTEKFLSDKGYRLMIVQLDVLKSDAGGQDELNDLVKWAQQQKLPVWALTASSFSVAEVYQRDHQLPYNFYQADGTMLKTMIRSNPGLFLFKDNVVVNKWPSTALPSEKELQGLMK